jgi:carotenoid cleavage oxygenase
MGNRYLEHNFGPVRDEFDIVDLEVTGTIPEHLDGRYLRNGPNPIAAPDPATYHWFTGAGMVHGVRLRDGRAEWYRNRWVRSRDVAAALGETRRPGPRFAGMDFPANTNIIGHAGRTLALVEAGPRPYELSNDLDTIGPCDFDGTLPGGYTAHPLLDPATGELHAVSYYWGWGNRVQYSVVGTDGRVRRTVDIEVAGQPMMHAFSLTERHVIVYDLPARFDIDLASTVVPRIVARPMRYLGSRLAHRAVPHAIAARLNRRAGNDVLPYRWDPDYPARVGVLPRDGGPTDVRWFDVEPCYVYHPLNAYDDGDQIILDVVRHPKTFDTERHGPDEGTPTLDRWTVDLRAHKVLEERIDDHAQEFPRIDERLTGRRARYGYSVGFQPDAEPAPTVLRHDMAKGDTEVRSLGPNRQAGEFVFVPDAPDTDEDQGVLMGFVYNVDTDRSDLVVLDAATLATVADIHLPTRVPHGFHGNWLPASNHN